MTSPSMQPERSKSGKPGKPQPSAAARRGLLGDPGQSVQVSLAWSSGGVTVTFPEAPSSATWDSTAMTARTGSTTVFTGTGRNATNSMSAVFGSSTYRNNSIGNDSTQATLDKV